MPIKFKINILFFCLYLGSIGKYFLNQIFISKSTDTVVILIIDFLIFVITLNSSQRKLRSLKYLYVFALISSIAYAISDNFSLLAHVNGLRETLVFICYFIIFEDFYESQYLKKINDRFITFALIFLIIQIPVAVLQFIKFGPGDQVGGTYGYGGSGVLTFSIFLLISYLIENRIKTSKERLKKGMPLLIFLIPIALNETKISFILLPLYFLGFIDFKKIGSSIIITGLGILSVISFSYIYTTQENINYKNPLEGIFSGDFLEKYLIGDEIDYGFDDVPRFTKITLGIEKLISDGDLIFGKDYGAFKGSQLEIGSEFSKRYEWLLRGSRPYSFFLLISGGVILLLFIIWMVLSEILRKHRIGIENYSSPLLVFLTVCFFILLFYNDGLRSNIFSLLFVFILFFAKQFKKQPRSTKLNKYQNYL